MENGERIRAKERKVRKDRILEGAAFEAGGINFPTFSFAAFAFLCAKFSYRIEVKCPRRESNPDLAFRKRLFYPLNYEDA